ncbi:pirin family protein [Lentisalinibacter orientalis]|uniref:pirin family protein n=1 Tax=Lentisalinibacter orientalis TaxID=2992241 RepID=UPI00386EFC88
MAERTLSRVIPGVETSDGAGVRLRRSLGASEAGRLDPFLMLDEFGTDNPDDYIAGFPPHPHRGFETVTYMLNGHMRHEDHMGNVGELTEGGVQWMTAGRGVIHSEMPQQREGRMRGFQLWINLPAAEKMKPAAYRDIPADDIPAADIPGGRVKVIAGAVPVGGTTVTGPIHGLSTEPLFIDVELAADHLFECPVPAGHNAFLYVYEGSITVGRGADSRELPPRSAGILGEGDSATVESVGDTARFILLAGKPIGEPVAQYGPFVMNTREEIERAIADYRSGALVDD